MKTTHKILLCLLLLPPLSIKAENKPYQHDIIQNIVAKLYDANKNFNKKKPTIEFKNTTSQVASYVPDKNVIVVETQAYQICQSMGKDSLNALAFLLGHELTHFYQHAHTKVGFISNFLSYDKTPNADTRLEQEADIQGAFNAYLAGYDMGNNIGLVLDKIYTVYQLKGKALTGYPSFEERQKVAEEVQQKVSDLIKVYESANYLAALGQYDFSRLCYEHILEVYQNREVYNNLGILSALSAADLTVKEADNLVFPYEMDWNTRLSRKKSRGTGTLTDYSQAQRTTLLKRAQTYFETASDMDKTYLVAPLNRLCILAQLDKTEEAIQAYTKLKKRLKDPLQQDYAKLVYALILSKKIENQEESSSILIELSQNTHVSVANMANYNKAILEKRVYEMPTAHCDFTIENTMIDNIQLRKVSLKEGTIIPINTLKKAYLIFQKQANSTVIQAKINGQYYFVFQRVKGFLPQNTEGGVNDKMVLTTNGSISLCEEQQVAFRYDNQHKVVEWVKFYGN